jgi:hypothetical protein
MPVTQDNLNSNNVSIDDLEIELNRQLDKIMDEADAVLDETTNNDALTNRKWG